MPKRRGGRGQQGGQGTDEAPAAKRCNASATAGPAATTAVEDVRYRIEGGLRHVEPYDFDFTTFVKQRWLGRKLLEVFCKEFIAYSSAYYKAAIEAGRVTVNGQQVSPEHVLKNGERIVHRAVRCQENPVLDRGTIPVVADTDKVLVVNKPSSIPIHPCGSYRFNCLIAVLRAQGVVSSTAELHTTHRLDRLTSGLVILTKTKAEARQWLEWFTSGEVRKSYLARVRGRFRDLLDRASAKLSLPAGLTLVQPGRLRLEGYIRCLDRKVGKYTFEAEKLPCTEGEEEPKDSATEFELVGDAGSGESIVRCMPLTGRTHQIRVHLRHLGHPIANDSCYGGELRTDPSLPLIPHVQQNAEVAAQRLSQVESGESGADASKEMHAAEEAETTMHASGIFLHALTYAVPGAEYSSEAPAWAECTAEVS